MGQLSTSADVRRADEKPNWHEEGGTDLEGTDLVFAQPQFSQMNQFIQVLNRLNHPRISPV